MNAPVAFEVIDGIGLFRPVATGHLQQAIALVSQAIAHARASGVGKLLIVTTRLKGFNAPTVAARLQMVREWAVAADGQITLAVVARSEFIDPEKIGVVAAATFGTKSNVFENEAEALRWLREN